MKKRDYDEQLRKEESMAKSVCQKSHATSCQVHLMIFVYIFGHHITEFCVSSADKTSEFVLVLILKVTCFGSFFSFVDLGYKSEEILCIPFSEDRIVS